MGKNVVNICLAAGLYLFTAPLYLSYHSRGCFENGSRLAGGQYYEWPYGHPQSDSIGGIVRGDSGGNGYFLEDG